MLNPDLDPSSHAAAYARDGVVRIQSFLQAAAAEALGQALERATPWSLVHSGPAGEHVMVEGAALAALTPAELQARVAAVTRQASQGFGYIYLVYPMINAYLDGRDPGHPLHALTEFLNSPEFMDFAFQVTGERAVKVDAQASHYRPGHFLALHDDLGEGERRAAYTLSFTRAWRPDWGGQLMFHEPGGDIWRGYLPRFNTLTFFKVPMAHSVAAVAPYAPAPRLTIAGWLRDDPPHSAG